MTAQEITKLLERSPFVPFRLHLSDGQSFEVRHPDFFWVFRTRLEVAVPASDDARIKDHAEHISLLHIARIEEMPLVA
jgi:hypothetical protein